MLADFGVFGGDDRSGYLVDDLLLRGYGVITRGVKQKRDSAASLEELAEQAKVLVGPVPLSKYIGDREKQFDRLELCMAVKAGQLLFAGQIPEDIREIIRYNGARCVDFMKSREVQQANAVLTAEGCLAECIAHRNVQLRGARVCVCGYGCCGREIARVFSGIGANVTVAIRRTQSAWEAASTGYSVCYPEGLGDILSRQEIIINTVPERIVSEEQLDKISKASLLVEIASTPGGFDMNDAKKKGLQAISCPGLPGRYFPEGAARILADFIVAAC